MVASVSMVQWRLRRLSQLPHNFISGRFKSRNSNGELLFFAVGILCLNILDPYKCWSLKDLPKDLGLFLNRCYHSVDGTVSVSVNCFCGLQQRVSPLLSVQIGSWPYCLWAEGSQRIGNVHSRQKPRISGVGTVKGVRMLGWILRQLLESIDGSNVTEKGFKPVVVLVVQLRSPAKLNRLHWKRNWKVWIAS